MMLMYKKICIKNQIKLSEIRSALLLPLVILPLQSLAADSVKGNIKNGQSIAAEKCDRCHGSGGVSEDVDTPHLASQSAAYTLKQINDYKNKIREDKNMYKRVRKLNDQQMADIALWYESLKLPEIDSSAKTNLKPPQLVATGDTKRAIPPCSICHGKDGKTTAEGAPILAGQSADYMISTMEYFKDGSRNNDPGAAVQTIIQKLSDIEIEAIAHYYAALGGRPTK